MIDVPFQQQGGSGAGSTGTSGKGIATPQVLSIQRPANDTLTGNSGTQQFATTYTFPANVIGANNAFRVSVQYALTSNATTTANIACMLNGTNIYNATQTALLAATTANAHFFTLFVVGQSAPAAAANVFSAIAGGTAFNNNANYVPFNTNQVVQPVSINTKIPQTLTLTYSSGQTGNNAMQLYNLTVEQIA